MYQESVGTNISHDRTEAVPLIPAPPRSGSEEAAGAMSDKAVVG